MKEPTKAILVIDMPECCLDCPCSYTYGYRIGTPTSDICEVVDRKLSKENMNDKKPDWCPLKPMSKRIGSASEYGSDEVYIKHLINWKKEIDEILGDEE